VPPTLSIGAFVLGGVLLLLSVVRGGFKIFGAEVKETAGGIARVIAFLAGVVLIVTGFLHDGKDQSDKPPDHGGLPVSPPAALVSPSGKDQALPQGRTSGPPREVDRPARQSNPNPVVSIEWRRAETQELMGIIASLTPAERYALGTNAAVSGTDVYAIHVRVTNIGGVPVEVSPERFQLTYAGQPIPLNRADDRFFHATRLEPNYHTEGFVTFVALNTIGLAIATGGRLTYQDPSIQVQYAR
jgi:hypothetical protein